jgi:hypothetical protein
MNTEPKPATGEWTSEALARQFHELYESYACEFAYETRQETRAFDPTTPNGRLMIAVCKEIADEINAALTAERDKFNIQEQQWLGENLILTDEIQQLRARLAADALAKAGK